jgi:hypothetical protein
MNYSQNKEQEHILNYFGDYVGTFLDLGCNDCLTFSNTRALALKGWKGIFIDPSPKAMERCKTLYNGHKGFYFYQVAISSHNGKAILQESGPLCSAADVGLVSTFHPSEQERFKRTVNYEPIEGDEMNILPDIDLSKTRLVCIEWNSKPELKEQYDKYLDGFNVIYTSGENLIYAR